MNFNEFFAEMSFMFKLYYNDTKILSYGSVYLKDNISVSLF